MLNFNESPGWARPSSPAANEETLIRVKKSKRTHEIEKQSEEGGKNGRLLFGETPEGLPGGSTSTTAACKLVAHILARCTYTRHILRAHEKGACNFGENCVLVSCKDSCLLATVMCTLGFF